MPQAVLVDGGRTPFLKVGTVQKSATDFGVAAVRGLRKKMEPYANNLYALIDFVSGANIGNQVLHPDASNIARVIALRSGIPDRVPAVTTNINCASGLDAVLRAVEKIETGQARCVLVVAVEVMSDYALVYPREQRELMLKRKYVSKAKMSSWKRRLAGGVLDVKARLTTHDPLYTLETGLTDPVCGLKMDQISDKLAEEFEIYREEVDRFAEQSQHRAAAAQISGRLVKEIIEFDGHIHDNGIRHGQTLKALAKLPTNYPGGVTTAGNASQLTDGAVALVLASQDFATALHLPVMAKLSSGMSATVGGDPARMGIVPVAAIERVLTKNAMKLSDVDLVETNEAFASVVLSQQRLLQLRGVGDLDFDRTNVNGGAIALGHPLAASGARLILTLAHELQIREKRLGLATACVGGGEGVAMILERPE